MILDEKTEFADATALSTVGTGIANFGDVIDSSVARDLGTGETLYLVIQVTTAVTSGGAATVAFQVVSDATGTIATDGSATVHAVTEDIGKATLVAGYTRIIPLPPEGSNSYERYLAVQQNVGTAALTAGAVNAFLTLDPAAYKAYPDA
jgi:hypothetical protein